MFILHWPLVCISLSLLIHLRHCVVAMEFSFSQMRRLMLNKLARSCTTDVVGFIFELVPFYVTQTSGSQIPRNLANWFKDMTMLQQAGGQMVHLSSLSLSFCYSEKMVFLDERLTFMFPMLSPSSASCCSVLPPVQDTVVFVNFWLRSCPDFTGINWTVTSKSILDVIKLLPCHPASHLLFSVDMKEQTQLSVMLNPLPPSVYLSSVSSFSINSTLFNLSLNPVSICPWLCCPMGLHSSIFWVSEACIYFLKTICHLVRDFS